MDLGAREGVSSQVLGLLCSYRGELFGLLGQEGTISAGR